MARCMQLDDQDKTALRKLDDDFVISANGETATVEGEMECPSSEILGQEAA